MAWRCSVCGTAEVVWKPRFLWQWPSAHLHFLVSCFSFSSWQYLIDSLWDSGLVSLLASQAHQHHGHLTKFGDFGSVGMCQILNKSGQQKEAWSAPKFIGKQVQWCWFSKKHNGPTPANDIAAQIITDCGNLTLDFKQLGLWASPPFH